MSFLNAVEQVATTFVALCAVVGIAWPKIRGWQRMADDYNGRPARQDPSGVEIEPARPGAIARIITLEQQVREVHKELHPNGGSSLRDAVDRLEQARRADPAGDETRNSIRAAATSGPQ